MASCAFFIVLAFATIANRLALSLPTAHETPEQAVENVDRGTTEGRRSLRANAGSTSKELLLSLQPRLPELTKDVRESLKKEATDFIKSHGATEELIKRYNINMDRVIRKMHFIRDRKSSIYDVKTAFYMALGSEYFNVVIPTTTKRPTGLPHGNDLVKVNVMIQWLNDIEPIHLVDRETIIAMATGSEYLSHFDSLYPKLHMTETPVDKARTPNVVSRHSYGLGVKWLKATKKVESPADEANRKWGKFANFARPSIDLFKGIKPQLQSTEKLKRPADDASTSNVKRRKFDKDVARPLYRLSKGTDKRDD